MTTYASHRREMDRKGRRIRRVEWKAWKVHQEATGITGCVKIDPDNGSLWVWVSATRQLTWVRPFFGPPKAYQRTPGPWKAHKDHCITTGNGFARIAKVFDHEEGVDVSEQQAMGDTYLIAAAPDLLDVCKRVLAGGYIFNGTACPDGAALCDSIRSAIAKAEGEGRA